MEMEVSEMEREEKTTKNTMKSEKNVYVEEIIRKKIKFDKLFMHASIG